MIWCFLTERENQTVVFRVEGRADWRDVEVPTAGQDTTENPRRLKRESIRTIPETDRQPTT